ncbi:molybdenum cofactor guanylyltransferase, partial [bacterium]
MTGAILAGGKSVRMGFNKALIKTNDETIIERTIRLFKGIFDHTFIVANDVLLYENLDTPIFADIHKGAGSLGGIYTALVHSKTA